MTDSPLPFIDTVFQDYVDEGKDIVNNKMATDIIYNKLPNYYYEMESIYYKCEDDYDSIKIIINFLSDSVKYAIENREKIFYDMITIQNLMTTIKKLSETIPRTYIDLTKIYMDEAIENSKQSESYADLSENWAINHRGSWTRDDSKWYSEESITNNNYAKKYAIEGYEYVEEAKTYKDTIEVYSDVVIPEFYLDMETLTLYQLNYSSIDKNIFTIEDGNLYHEHLSTPYEKVLVQNEKRYRLGIENGSIFYQEF